MHVKQEYAMSSVCIASQRPPKWQARGVCLSLYLYVGEAVMYCMFHHGEWFVHNIFSKYHIVLNTQGGSKL